MNNDLAKTLIICLTIIFGIFIYTQNTGFNACYKQHEKFHSKENFEKYGYDKEAAYTCGKNSS